MLNNLLDFDASDIIALIGGAVLACMSEPARVWVMNRIDKGHRKITLPGAKALVYVMVFAGLLVSLWSTSNTQHELQRNSRQTLLIAEAACEEQRLSTIERAALHKLFLAVITPPPEVASLPDGDPAKGKWAMTLVNEYIGTLERTNAERRELADRFAHNPPQRPSCGNRPG